MRWDKTIPKLAEWILNLNCCRFYLFIAKLTSLKTKVKAGIGARPKITQEHSEGPEGFKLVT